MTLPWVVLDFLFIYSFYASIIFYYILGVSEDSYGFRFINNTLRNTLIWFFSFHLAATILPSSIVILGNLKRDNRFFYDQNMMRPVSLCNKLGLLFFTFFQFYYIRVIFGPRVYPDYQLKEDMKTSYTLSRLGGHIILNVILIILFCINNDGLEPEIPYSFLKWLPVWLCGA